MRSRKPAGARDTFFDFGRTFPPACPQALTQNRDRRFDQYRSNRRVPVGGRGEVLA